MGVLVNGRMGKAAIAVNRQGEPVRDIGESRGRGLPGSLSTDPHPLVVLRYLPYHTQKAPHASTTSPLLSLSLPSHAQKH